MKIRGFLPTSFSDWDGRLVSILFLGGCNYRCPFCQNYLLLSEEGEQHVYHWPDIAAQLKTRTNWIDGVVISGGEPMMHPELRLLCAAIKGLGYAIKLDTNGSFPFGLISLCADGLVDYVAMDIKTALDERYQRACGAEVEVGLVRRSIRFLLDGKIDYEFRTTLVPGLVGPDELAAVAQTVKGARKYALQQFVPENARVAALRKKKPYPGKVVEGLVAILKPAVKEVVVRGKVSSEGEALPGTGS